MSFSNFHHYNKSFDLNLLQKKLAKQQKKINNKPIEKLTDKDLAELIETINSTILTIARTVESIEEITLRNSEHIDMLAQWVKQR